MGEAFARTPDGREHRWQTPEQEPAAPPPLEPCATCGHAVERGLICFYCLFGRDVAAVES